MIVIGEVNVPACDSHVWIEVQTLENENTYPA